MIKPPSGKNLILILITTAVALILANILIDKFFTKHQTLNQLKNITAEDANKNFIVILKSFGLNEELIKIKNNNGGNNKFYNITVPSDLPIPVILNDVFIEFKNRCEIISEEKEIGGKSILTLINSDKTLLSAQFDYSKFVTDLPHFDIDYTKPVD